MLVYLKDAILVVIALLLLLSLIPMFLVAIVGNHFLSSFLSIYIKVEDMV